MERLAIIAALGAAIAAAVIMLLLGTAHGRLVQDAEETILWALPEGRPMLEIGDCLRLEDGDVAPLPHGYLIQSLNHFIPEGDAKPSGDDAYWLCENSRAGLSFYSPLAE